MNLHHCDWRGEIKIDVCVFRMRSASSYFYERVSCSVVGDGEAQSIFGFKNFYLLLDPFNVGEDKILEADLAPQQLLHVDLVSIEGAE